MVCFLQFVGGVPADERLKKSAACNPSYLWCPMSPDSSATPAETTAEQGASANSTAEVKQLVWIRSAALSGIFFLLVMYTMYFAAALIMPIVLALLLSLALSPVASLFERLYIPRAIGALIVMLAVAGILAAAVYALASPAAKWLEKAPTELQKMEYKLAWVKEPIRKIEATREQIENLASATESSGEAAAAAAAAAAESSQPSFSLINAVLTRTPEVLFGIAVTFILLYFLLASGDAFLKKLVRITPLLRDKIRVVETARDVQQHVSLYLGTIALINIGVGMVVSLGLYLLGMPNPILWGTMTGVLNFIPYLGVAISIVIVTFASFLTFETVGQILLPGALIFAVNVVEGQFMTPIITGRRLALSPVAIFVTLVVLGWMWGIIGVLIAVPVLASIKLVCDQVEPLSSVGTLLGRD
jgi:predicted PurR-regulated permease PerM